MSGPRSKRWMSSPGPHELQMDPTHPYPPARANPPSPSCPPSRTYPRPNPNLSEPSTDPTLSQATDRSSPTQFRRPRGLLSGRRSLSCARPYFHVRCLYEAHPSSLQMFGSSRRRPGQFRSWCHFLSTACLPPPPLASFLSKHHFSLVAASFHTSSGCH